jgi:flagellar biosynthetic protein FliQ
MDISEAVYWGQQSMIMVALISGPVLLVAMVVGLVISLLQAITQVQEMTLVFVPKILAVLMVLAVMGGWMMDHAVNFGQRCFQAIGETRE